MLILIFIIIFFGRLNSYFSSYETLNPDESQMISNAISIAGGNFNFLEIDTTTSGFMNSLILTWPRIFGFEITFFSTKITSIFLISMIIYYTFKVSSEKIPSKILNILFLAPILIFFSLTKDPDFSHYSSELLSLCILIVSYYFIVNNQKKTLHIYVIAPVLLSLVFFAKIQFFPIAIILLFIIFFEIFTNKNLRKFKLFFLTTFSFSACFILFFILLNFNGNAKDYINNNFTFVNDFIKTNQASNILGEKILFDQGSQENLLKKTFKNHLFLNLIFHQFYIYFIIFILLFIKLIKLKKTELLFTKDLNYLSIIILGLIIVILIPGTLHRHYLITLLPFVALYVPEIIFTYKKKYKTKIFSFNLCLVFLTLLILSFISGLYEKKKFYSKKYKLENFQLEAFNLKSPKIYNNLFELSEFNNIYIWGWAPQWYVLSYMSPATRETISQKQIEKIGNRDYYRGRLIQDLIVNNPNLIIDSVKKNSFKYTEDNQSIKNFSQLDSYIKKNYVKLEQKNINCPDFFLRKDNYKKFINKNINYTISLEKNKNLFKLNDYSITEDICDDAVYFENEKNYLISLDLKNLEKISKINILGAKNNYKKTEIKIFFYKKNVKIIEKNILLNKHPFWTTLNIDEFLIADQIKLDISEIKKKNFGINEIKIFK